ncbi:MAG: transglutaminase domain-containing protein [bacterium]
MGILSDMGRELGAPVLPGKQWGYHYPGNGAQRADLLKGLLDGTVSSEEAALGLRPDAITYSLEDLQTEGFEAVSGRLRAVTSTLQNYDYEGLAEFVGQMQGKDVSPEEAQALYDRLTGGYVQKRAMDSFGSTGRRQMEAALQGESRRLLESTGSTPQERVLQALRAHWLCEGARTLRSDDRDGIAAALSQDELRAYEGLKEDYLQYMSGDKDAYRRLATYVQESFGRAEPLESSQSMQDLEKELEPYMDQAVPPGMPSDPAIPPDDNDEYHTPPPRPGRESGVESEPQRPIFEIAPTGSSTKPLTGYYISGRKSYYDEDAKVWSKRKQLMPYSESPAGTDRQVLSGRIDAGLKSVPIPNGYALDAATLRVQQGTATLSRDQNGCFYIQSTETSDFTVEFLKEPTAFISPPIGEDVRDVHRGRLSDQTEQFLATVRGTPTEMAVKAQGYIRSNHFYPGGGDLKAAQALQHKLRSESTADTYFQNLDASEYLECYSSLNLWIAMMRSVDVPCRVVLGHMIDSARDGKAAMDATTGHAWGEFWDGSEWRRIDPTPPPKPEDKKPEGDPGQGEPTPSQQAEDGGIEGDTSQPTQTGESGEQAGQGQGSGQEMGQVSDQEMEEAQSQLEQAQNELQKMDDRKAELNQKIQDAKDFNDLKELHDKMEKEDLLDDMKEDLVKRLEAKQEQMKDNIKEQLDEMVEDGFMDEDKRKQLEEALDEGALEKLDQMKQQLERESGLYNEYDAIRQEVQPLVDEWLGYFLERLPRQDEIEVDEDALARRGTFNRRSAMRARNLLFGTVRNPHIINPVVKPLFLAKMMVDVSGSMQGEKLRSARKTLVFLSELFSAIKEQFGYIKFSIDIFSDNLTTIKGFDQDYDRNERYDFKDGSTSTVKVRLMERLASKGGTNMLAAITAAADDLTEQASDNPEFASAFYFMGDGGDTCGNGAKVREFMQTKQRGGFGEHMHSAILLGDESQRRTLSDIFGEDHTAVAPNFDALIETFMGQFDDDISQYLSDKTR